MATKVKTEPEEEVQPSTSGGGTPTQRAGGEEREWGVNGVGRNR